MQILERQMQLFCFCIFILFQVLFALEQFIKYYARNAFHRNHENDQGAVKMLARYVCFLFFRICSQGSHVIMISHSLVSSVKVFIIVTELMETLLYAFYYQLNPVRISARYLSYKSQTFNSCNRLKLSEARFYRCLLITNQLHTARPLLRDVRNYFRSTVHVYFVKSVCYLFFLCSYVNFSVLLLLAFVCQVRNSIEMLTACFCNLFVCMHKNIALLWYDLVDVTQNIVKLIKQCFRFFMTSMICTYKFDM
eukprot:TRINITY_DN5519_c0_g1_i7.p1 TRINITY_DN5519_c0_g1~~TRINITY_DN5519_c0_g1_i7.p1  ORF type:complete len:251 (-),score=-19.84 TRINITY_DN5519_c0_g1_i7:205-957(-)